VGGLALVTEIKEDDGPNRLGAKGEGEVFVALKWDAKEGLRTHNLGLCL